MATKSGSSPRAELSILLFRFSTRAASADYLPLMMVLWLLILRGTAVEFRNHILMPYLDSLLGLRFLRL